MFINAPLLRGGTFQPVLCDSLVVACSRGPQSFLGGRWPSAPDDTPANT
jgi:hypothetical protein